MSNMKTYSAQSKLSALYREALCLRSTHKRQAQERVAGHIEVLRELEALIWKQYGVTLRNKDVLDIGPGQFLMHMIYFARQNRVKGIDLDVIPHGFNPLPYLQMLRHNGPRRTLKTIGRKVMGIDGRYAKELKRQLGMERIPNLDVRRMDAMNITFPDSSFDFVHSRSVFHHIPEPDVAMRQVARILRPGGVALLSFHLYTSENGCLDPRIFTERRAEVGQWVHLRPSMAGTYTPNAYVNKLRMTKWRELFAKEMPGVEYVLHRNKRANVEEDARSLQNKGELADYNMEELLTDEVIVLWRKSAGN